MLSLMNILFYSVIYSERSMAGPHCERLGDIASQIDLSPPADLHRILRRSCESVCLSSAQFFCFPRVTPTPLTAAPLPLSVLVGVW